MRKTMAWGVATIGAVLGALGQNDQMIFLGLMSILIMLSRWNPEEK